MTPKEVAKDFLMLAGLGSVQEAYDKYVAENFIHHNQYFKGDRESLLKAMKDAHKESPNETIEIKQIFEDGNKIVTYSHVVKKEMEIAVVHIFKFDDDKIVEMWDVGQLIDPDSPNSHGLF